MKLRNKALIAISVVWIIFLAFTYLGSQFFLFHSFMELEQTQANKDLDRVDEALGQVNYALSTFSMDWSHWNDLYSYVQGKNPSFIPNNMSLIAFINSNINFFSLWDKNEKLLFSASINTIDGKYTDDPAGLHDYLFSGSSLLNPQHDLNGYINTDKGVMLIAASDITDGNKTLPPLGTLIAARYLDHALISKISHTIKIPLQLFTLSEIDASKKMTKQFEELKTVNGGHYANPINEKQLEGFSLIKDINNKPIGMFRTIIPRYTYASGKKAIHYYLMAFLVLGIIFSFVMVWLLRKLIIRRLEKLDGEIAEIGDKNAINHRVTSNGSDELSSVSKKVNHMLDIIQASQDELEERVRERTQAFQKANIQLQQEISERKSIEKELVVHKEHLTKLAHYDNLTALPNRVFFNELLNKAITHAKRHEKILAILFIDLDRFKNINDALGHTFGDLVLKEIAARFNGLLRAGDVLARLGGDEFIILLNDIHDPKFAGPVAEKILKTCAEPIKIDAHEFFLTASIGVSIYPNDGDSLEDLQKNADMAMYKAKKSGGGIYQYYTPEMDTAAHEYIKMEAALRKGIQQNEFILYFQPQFDLKTGKINRVEALIRWESKELGLIMPSKFITLAEETGLIMPIGEWALHEACRIAKKWQDDGFDPITIAVNISPKQFRHQDVAQIVSDALKETKLDPKYLEVEITETAVMDNVDEAINKLALINKMGVKISIDDFGTGYTSINYLRQFPVSVLKIDQTFIKGLPDNQNDVAITSAVISLGHNLGLEVVAEGVETTEQMQYLHEHNCDLIQGYLISRPLPANKVVLQFAKNTEQANTSLSSSQDFA